MKRKRIYQGNNTYNVFEGGGGGDEALITTSSHSLNIILGLLPINLFIKCTTAQTMLRLMQARHALHGRVITGSQA